MSSTSTLQRQKMKLNNPTLYAAYKERQKEASRKRRQQKKEKWENEPHTRAILNERKRELELTRLRVQKHRNKDRRITRNSNPVERASKRPRDMTEEERKEHKRKQQQAYRARQTPQKKRYIKEKDREYRRAISEKKKLSKAAIDPATLLSVPVPNCHYACQAPIAPVMQIATCTCNCINPPPLAPACTPPNPTIQNTGIVTTPKGRLHKTLYNLTSKFKLLIKGKSKGDPQVYAKVVKNLATPRTPEKRSALRQLLFTTPNKKTPKPKKAARRIRKSADEKTALYTSVKAFYVRQDVARVLPHKRYATKAGPGYVMNITIHGAFRLFKSERPTAKIQLTKFAQLRPKYVRKLGAVNIETCLCLYCLNVRYKIAAINRVFAKCSNLFRLPDETRVMNFFLCSKPEGSKWHNFQCINGTCNSCNDLMGKLKVVCQPYMTQFVTWTHWERRPTRETMKLDVHVKSGQLSELLSEFVLKDLLQPVLGTTFIQHSFRALWQFSQYSDLKNSLKDGEVLLVMDFAENRKAMYNEEVKTAHFGKGQITLHPVVAFYKNGDAQLVRHSLMFITDDIQHDYHAVHAFTIKAIEFIHSLFSSTTSPTFFIFSDGCAAQYKGKGAFADLSLFSTAKFERLYFGSEHGKGEADGETGVLSQAMHRAVCGNRAVFRDAADLYSWGLKEMRKNEPLFKRDFFLIGEKEINRDRPQTEVATLPGTRKIHHLKRVEDYVVQARYLACFCPPCRSLDYVNCLNLQHVGPFDTFKLKPRHPVQTPLLPGPSCLDEAFLQSPEELPIKRMVPKVGDFVRVIFKVGKKDLAYNALVIETTVALKKNEIMVSYLKDCGAYYIFPAKEDLSVIALTDIDLINIEILEVPTIDNRNRHFFL